ncbi:50S ribosomal protein L21 [Candidatus Kuenenbacteria bacterium]|nr:50S ribosomal protein L21 [Candidatus Kuenenbacteria bacterium]
MSLAVIKTGGKQYKVSKDLLLKVEKLPGNVGDKIEFDQVLLVSDDKGAKLELGQPFLKDKKIEAEIIEQGRAKKINVVKYKRKTRYRRKFGHRQAFTQVKFAKV